MLTGHFYIFFGEMSFKLFWVRLEIGLLFFVVVEFWEFFIFWILTPCQVCYLKIFSMFLWFRLLSR